jgi:hypothetical protein
MPVSVFRRCLTALLVVAWVAFAISAAFAVVAPLVGQPLITSWPATTNHSRVLELPLNGIGSATARLDQGVVAFESANWISALLKMTDVVVMGGLFVLFLTKLRNFALDVSLGRPFTGKGALRFRHLAYILFCIPAWQLVDAVLWQSLLLYNNVSGGTALVSTFSRITGAAENIRLIPNVDITLIFAGLVMMVFGEAVRLGAEVQRDSDEVV